MSAPQERKSVIYEGYPKDDNEAASRYVEYSSKDPFPRTAPALLNSADIKAYIKHTGMIHPFYETELQSASYKVRIGGRVVYWEYASSETVAGEKGDVTRVERDLRQDGDSFELLPNSIAFVTLEPVFRIPKYIALRFNLQITHIYKGLLLGTGPLVDPGFNGRLSIPLHNLTNNSYRFNYGDTLITMEFTKLSPNIEWENSYESDHFETYCFEKIPSRRSVDEYIKKALNKDQLDNVISSIPDAINEGKMQARKAKNEAETAKNEAETARNEAETARNEAEEARKAAEVAKTKTAAAESAANTARTQNTIITIGTLIAIIGTVITLVTLAFNAVSKANERYDDISTDLQDMQTKEIVDLNDEIKRLNGLIDDLEKKIDRLESAKQTTNGADDGSTN